LLHDEAMNATHQETNSWIEALIDLLPVSGEVFRCATAEELAEIHRDWIKQTAKAVTQRSALLTLCEASSVLRMANSTIDAIEMACAVNGFQLIDILVTLYPIEDIVVAMEIAVTSRLGRRVRCVK